MFTTNALLGIYLIANAACVAVLAVGCLVLGYKDQMQSEPPGPQRHAEHAAGRSGEMTRRSRQLFVDGRRFQTDGFPMFWEWPYCSRRESRLVV
jgi:hypothetical protein